MSISLQGTEQDKHVAKVGFVVKTEEPCQLLSVRAQGRSPEAVRLLLMQTEWLSATWLSQQPAASSPHPAVRHPILELQPHFPISL